MGILPLVQSLQATHLAYGSAATMFAANQQRMALANTVTGNESPHDLMRIQAMDKALTLQGEVAKTNYLAAQAMLEGAAKMREQNRQLKERLMASGAVFV